MSNDKINVTKVLKELSIVTLNGRNLSLLNGHHGQLKVIVTQLNHSLCIKKIAISCWVQ